jgi:hypothetical protein
MTMLIIMIADKTIIIAIPLSMGPLKNAHLRRWPSRLLLDVPHKYACVAPRRPALHLGIFERPFVSIFSTISFILKIY